MLKRNGFLGYGFQELCAMDGDMLGGRMFSMTKRWIAAGQRLLYTMHAA